MPPSLAATLLVCALAAILGSHLHAWEVERLTEGPGSGLPHEARSVERLARYLEACVASLPAYETDILLDGFRGYTQHPRTTSGKYIRCLAQHHDVRSVAVLFYGYPGPNGVFSAALGLRARALAGNATPPLVTLERHADRCALGQRFLKENHVAGYVDLRCRFLCEGVDEQGCMAEIKEAICPEGPLDLLIEDITPAGHLALKSALSQCTPKLLFVENSGIRDTHAWIGAGNRSMSGEWWAHHSEDEIHGPAERRQGPWRVVVGKRPSDLPEDVVARCVGLPRRLWLLLRWGWWPPPVRRFSVYAAARSL